MIRTEAGLDLTIEQLARMYRVLADLHQDVKPKSTSWYNVMAEGPIDEIRKLQREIDEYLELADPISAAPSPEQAVAGQTLPALPVSDPAATSGGGYSTTAPQ